MPEQCPQNDSCDEDDDDGQSGVSREQEACGEGRAPEYGADREVDASGLNDEGLSAAISIAIVALRKRSVLPGRRGEARIHHPRQQDQGNEAAITGSLAWTGESAASMRGTLVTDEERLTPGSPAQSRGVEGGVTLPADAACGRQWASAVASLW